ncbi:hypothetical protein QQ045_026861 [Rhodiola kirilowii]
MEEITDGANNMNTVNSLKRNRIQVSNTKKPLFFYVNLAKRYMQQFNEVELSAIGMGKSTKNVTELPLNSNLRIITASLTAVFVQKVSPLVPHYCETEEQAKGGRGADMAMAIDAAIDADLDLYGREKKWRKENESCGYRNGQICS